MAKIRISQIEPQTVTAPALVWFEATELDGFDYPHAPNRRHDKSATRITYVWTVEAPSQTPDRYEAPNIPDRWNTPQRAYGKKVAFVFTEEDTTYRIRLWAIDDGGHIGEAETTVTTVSNAAVYATTVCLDPSGRFAMKPEGAVEVANVKDMQAALIGALGPSRVLIARGQMIDDFLLDGRRTAVTHIGAFGPDEAPRPVLNAVAKAANMFDFERAGLSPQIALDGLDCRGHWDAATETGRQTNNPLDFTSASIMHFTVWNCRFSGFGTIELAAGGEGWTGGLCNSEVTNWSGYGVYVPRAATARLAFVGSDIAQHPEALNSYKGNRNGLMNTQGPVRIPECGNVYIGASSFLARGGWSGQADQECLRLNSRCLEGSTYSIERCTLEGGIAMIKMSGSNSRATETPGHYLLDKVLLLAGGGKTHQFGVPHFGGTTIRNTLMVQLDVPSKDAFAYRQCLPLEPDQPDRTNLVEPVEIYNCSVMNLRRAENDVRDIMRITARTTFLTYTEENNIRHAPDLKEFAEDTHAPIDLKTRLAGFTPRYLGIRPNFDFETGVLEHPVGPEESFQILYPEGTDQAYWQNLPSSDDQHGLRMDRRTYFAALGDIQVTFQPTRISITNLTQKVWEREWKWSLRLDRKSQLPPIDTRYGNPTDQTLPLPIPGPGSPAILTGASRGRHAYDDFFGRVRPGPSETGRDHNGDPRPAEGGTAGAIHM